MSIPVTMPSLSPTMEEGTLAKWLVKEGDEIAAGDVIAEIETDKATMEVEVADEGRIGKLLVDEGTEGVEVNSLIAVLLEEGEEIDDVDLNALKQKAGGSAGSSDKAEDSEEKDKKEKKDQPEPEAEDKAQSEAPKAKGDILASPSARRMAEEKGVDLSTLKGSGPKGRILKEDVQNAEPGSGTESKTKGNGKAASRPDGIELPENVAPPAPEKDGERIFASPLARRVAEDQGIDLGKITGTGPEGRIILADVQEAAKSGAGAAEEAETGKPAEAPAGDGEYEEVRLSAMRKTIAKRMTQAKQDIPHFYLTVDIHLDPLLEMRKQANEGREDDKLSVNDFLIKAVATALTDMPQINVQFAGDHYRQFKQADIAVAVALEGGLITPIIRGADAKSLSAISREMKELAARARDGKLAPEEYQGGTISISNLGMYGIREFSAVINPPHGSILAIGQGERRAVVDENDEIVKRTMMSVNMACDHRVIDGAMGAEFLRHFKSLLEHPVRILV
ncbi:MAG: 2-oxo acid dehydrogenase subunit E2 [Alphaproteobacteria bacterium]|nr:2-oxo acid dehydrogenase subunit E2 [Alphaproteobacteria bacterium]